MASSELAYFGKSGSFTHLVAKAAHGSSKLVSKGTVREVIHYIKGGKNRRGIVPVENSSSGMILETIDSLVADTTDLEIQDEYSLNVHLHLLGKKGQKINKIYSHFAPFQHCEKWLQEHYPDAEQVVVDSTAAAAEIVSKSKNSAAIAQLASARLYRLNVIHKDIGGEARNLTQFFLLGHKKSSSKKSQESSLSVTLKNEVGSLHKFLGTFAKRSINLKRIMSRPIVGHPNKYVFFIGIEASTADSSMKKAIADARNHCKEIRVLGSYPVHPPFES